MVIIRRDITGKEFYMGNRVFMYGMKNRRLIEYLPLDRLIRCDLDNNGKYCCILIYAMPLNEHEQETCDLDYLGERAE